MSNPSIAFRGPAFRETPVEEPFTSLPSAASRGVQTPAKLKLAGAGLFGLAFVIYVLRLDRVAGLFSR
jgi:hypothetical protein